MNPLHEVAANAGFRECQMYTSLLLLVVGLLGQQGAKQQPLYAINIEYCLCTLDF